MSFLRGSSIQRRCKALVLTLAGSFAPQTEQNHYVKRFDRVAREPPDYWRQAKSDELQDSRTADIITDTKPGLQIAALHTAYTGAQPAP